MPDEIRKRMLAVPEPTPIALAEDDGFEAFVGGHSSRSNPHDRGTAEYKAWASGWTQAARYCGRKSFWMK